MILVQIQELHRMNSYECCVHGDEKGEGLRVLGSVVAGDDEKGRDKTSRSPWCALILPNVSSFIALRSTSLSWAERSFESGSDMQMGSTSLCNHSWFGEWSGLRFENVEDKITGRKRLGIWGRSETLVWCSVVTYW